MPTAQLIGCCHAISPLSIADPATPRSLPTADASARLAPRHVGPGALGTRMKNVVPSPSFELNPTVPPK